MNKQFLISAMHEINNGEFISDVAFKYAIPRTTFRSYLYKHFGKDQVELAKKGKWKPDSTTTETATMPSVKSSQPKPKNDVPVDTFDDEDAEDFLEHDKRKQFEEEVNYIITDSEVTVNVPQGITTVSRKSIYYKPLVTACMNQDYDALLSSLNKAKHIEKLSDGAIKIEGLEVSVNGKIIPSAYLDLIKREYNSDSADFTNLVSFFSRCHLNDISEDVSLQMFEFLKHNDISIDQKGAIIAWKFLTIKDTNKQTDIPTAFTEYTYVDAYSKKIEQQIGSIISMPRNQVDADPNVTCSTGLHVGAWNYVRGNPVIAKVRVNPEDVVSVPVDYDGMKLRCCKYEILDIKHGIQSIEDF